MLAKDTDAKSGDLAQDDGARALRRTFGSLAGTVIMPNAPAGTPRTLADLGLSTQRDGTFVLDGRRLTATLQSDSGRRCRDVHHRAVRHLCDDR